MYLHLKFSLIPVISDHITPTRLRFPGIPRWNPRGVTGSVCYLLLIIENLLDTTQEVDTRPPPDSPTTTTPAELGFVFEELQQHSVCIQAGTSWDSVTMAQV